MLLKYPPETPRYATPAFGHVHDVVGDKIEKLIWVPELLSTEHASGDFN